MGFAHQFLCLVASGLDHLDHEDNATVELDGRGVGVKSPREDFCDWGIVVSSQIPRAVPETTDKIHKVQQRRFPPLSSRQRVSEPQRDTITEQAHQSQMANDETRIVWPEMRPGFLITSTCLSRRGLTHSGVKRVTSGGRRLGASIAFLYLPSLKPELVERGRSGDDTPTVLDPRDATGIERFALGMGPAL